MSRFKAYEFSFNGLWINPHVIIVSMSEQNAMIMAREKIKEIGFDPETAHLDKTTVIEEGAIISENDGDY